MSANRTLAGAVLLVCSVMAPQSARASLVGLWQFEGDASDNSAFGNDGALLNGASLSATTPPAIGGAMSLNVNGGTQHVLVPHDVSLNITNALTIAGWVQPIGNIGWDGILAKNPSSNGSGINHAGNYELRIENVSRFLNLLYQQGGVNDTTGTNSGANTVPQGVWTHIAVAADAQAATFYLNGNPVATTTMPGNFGATNTNPLFIGSRADLFTVMNGLLDDVALFNQKLTQTEIAQTMSGDFTRFGVGGDPVNGSLVGNVTIADFSSQLGAPFNRQAQFLVDGSGLTPTGGHTISPDRFMWLSEGIGFGGPGDDADPFVIFDLGERLRLDGIQVWNYNEDLPGRPELLGRGVAEMEILIGDAVTGPFTSLGVFELDIAPGNNLSDFSQFFDVDATGQFVMFDILANHNGVTFPAPGGGPDASFVGLSEVRFFRNAPVPEPATGTLAVLALAALSWRGRRTLRRRAGGDLPHGRTR